MKTCRECAWDVPDPEDPSYKECDSPGGISEEIFEEYDDDQLPEHCGFFLQQGVSE